MRQPLPLAALLLGGAGVLVVGRPAPINISININTTASTGEAAGSGGGRAGAEFSERAASASGVLNNFLAAVVAIFPVNVAVNALTGLITTGEQVLADASGIQTSENDLKRVLDGSSSNNNSSLCADLTVVFARGTTEAGNVGALAGPPFFGALRAAVGNSASLAVQGVDYPADVEGFLQGGDQKGSETMAIIVQQAIDACPKTKLVMSGYSQGAQLVHNAAKLLPATVMAAVNSAVIFGDPDFGEPVQGVSASKTLVICHKGDDICEHGDLILVPHLTYGLDAKTAASFVIANAGGMSSDAEAMSSDPNTLSS